MKKILLFVPFFVFAACTSQKDIPLVYSEENTGSAFEAPAMPGLEELPEISGLPDALTFCDGRKVKRFSQWEERRNEILAQIQRYEVGEKPVTSKDCVTAVIKRWQEKEMAPPMGPPGKGGRPMFVNPYAGFKADTIVVKVTVGEESLLIHCPVIYPEGDGPFPAIIGVGQGAGSLPPKIFADRGIAMIGYPFFEVMSHTQKRGSEPINRLYPDLEYFGAYAAWPWGVSRLIDALEILGDESKIDTKHLAISGCSFAGKMALFSGAMDERIALTIAQEPGGGGAASWRVTETLGWAEKLRATSYAWFIEEMRQFSDCVDRLPIDHHELCALVAPRALLVLGNPDYEWLADPSGYVSCQAARTVWEKFGIEDRMGFSFVDGHPHCMLPESQYPELEAFVDRFLLDKDVDTRVTRAPMYEDVDWQRWMNADAGIVKDLPRAAQTPKEVSEAVDAFIEATETVPQDPEHITLHSIMILKHGEVVEERWLNGAGPDIPHTMWSVSKTFTSAAAGLAIRDGKLRLEDKVVSFFPDELPAKVSENLAAMTVRDLLTMTCGHDSEPRAVRSSNDPKASWTKAFLAQEVPHKPGEYYLYNSMGTYMVSAIVQKVTGEKVGDYLNMRLWQPLHIEKPQFDESPQGISCGGWGLHLKTEDMAKMGQLLLQGGVWNGAQILPADWVKEMSSYQVPSAPSGTRFEDLEKAGLNKDNNDWVQGYGYQMWICRHGAFRADGANGQYIMVFPDKDAVLVLTTDSNLYQPYLDIVWEYLYPVL